MAVAWLIAPYITGIYTKAPSRLDRFLDPIENWIYKLTGADPAHGMGWKEYFFAALLVNVVQMAIAFSILTLQGVLPLNPMRFGGMSWDLALNTVISFATNTNLQHYNGETTLSYLSQMGAIQFLQFTSAATGICMGVAMVRGLVVGSKDMGNFYVDFVRSLTQAPDPVLLRGSAHPRLDGGPPDHRRVRPDKDGRGGDRLGPRRAGGIARLDNAAGHKRRRLLRRQLGLSLHEPQPVVGHPRDLPDAAPADGNRLRLRPAPREEARVDAGADRRLPSLHHRPRDRLHPDGPRDCSGNRDQDRRLHVLVLDGGDDRRHDRVGQLLARRRCTPS